MMETAIIISGFGGQGVLLAGQVLAYAAMDNGRHVTWIPSYGPEMRGGTANCTIIISDAPIGSPIVAHPEIALVLNRPSFDKYEPLVKPTGLLVVNSSLVTVPTTRTDIESVYVPANELAAEWGTAKMLNMAVLGAMVTKWPILSLPTLEQALANHLPPDKAHLLGANIQVLRRGYESVFPETRTLLVSVG
jgi:2-oxoglutarate ferredoxin oxidoreductase subunit gamma